MNSASPRSAFNLTSDGANRFEKLTGANIGKQLAIVLDGKVQSAPSIRGRFATQAASVEFHARTGQDLAVGVAIRRIASFAHLFGGALRSERHWAMIRSGRALLLRLWVWRCGRVHGDLLSLVLESMPLWHWS
jgi:hypothetical protein